MFGPRGPSAFDSPPQSRVQPTEQPPVPLRISGPIPKAYHSRGSPPPPPIPPRSSSLPQSYASASLLDPDSIHKGLHNERSAYHCFLNVIIQSLWHLRAFRLRFIALDYNHVHRSDPCIFCALRTIFTQYQYSDSVIIPPDTLRQALHDIDRMQGQGRFLLGAQGDAEEALDEILRWLHADQVLRDKRDDGPGEDDLTCMPPCISHAVFGAQCMDVKVCACGATSDPETSTSFLYRVYVSDLLPRLHSTAPFSHVLRSLYKAQAFSCPTNLADAAYRCQGPARVDRWLLTQPIVFTLMLAWNVGMPREEIQEVWGALPPELLLEDFVRVPEGAGGAVYGLRGVVCWYGKHYVAFFESEVGERWLMFDDRRVSHVGHWEELCTRAVLGKLQPILAFYEKTEKLADSRTLAQVEDHRTPHRTLRLPSLSAHPLTAHRTSLCSLSPCSPCNRNGTRRSRRS